MAAVACFAFLLAEELDADDNVPFVADALRHLQGVRNKAERNYINTVVPKYSISEFQAHFQLTPTQVEELITSLEPLNWNFMRRKWPLRNIILSSLWTLTTLESYRDVAERFQTSKSVICDHVHEFCALIAEHFSDKIGWPKGAAAEALRGVPVPEAYLNGKMFYSINLMAFCDHTGRFVHVNAEQPGGWHNSQVFEMTEVGKALEEDPHALLQGRHLVGDATLPLSEHLLTPFPDFGNLVLRKGRYNWRILSTLKVIQNSFRVLHSRFHRLKSLQMHSIAKTSAAVKACCILHNVCLETDNPVHLDDTDCDTVSQEPFHLLPNGHAGSLGGISKRQDIAASLSKKRPQDIM
ncbi:hypothetical protein SKAU_G00184530 [Synaphobranchus kaupii]|uniref:DDE Tnp4 domain-containing protein n=1 Tax=Synaphobranchus kaupii TaxID=118154 RepID=A0A9Q1IVR0_SYNKA|nr:hypothetical protein SKAU_G00184530 [Synaphobranchus kaupii]